MVKSIQILFFLFCGISSFAQGNLGGVVTYKKILNIELNQDENIPRDILFKYQNMKQSMNVLNYTLRFNRDNSVFKMDDIMEVDNQKISKRAISKGSGRGIHYVDLKNEKHIHANELFGTHYNVSRDSKLEFTITHETKRIGDYTCYKAEAKEIIMILGRENVVSYIAWFTPQIPFNYGPALFYGLPGLILEADINNTKYLAVDIKLNIENLKIDTPKRGQQISREEYDEIGKKILDGMRQN